uniref:Uncharacterized protein n=1 Tax=Cacopsylla melanoneura TaxID=428564 RepID=A0A8D8RF46_9HEMI
MFPPPLFFQFFSTLDFRNFPFDFSSVFGKAFFFYPLSLHFFLVFLSAQVHFTFFTAFIQSIPEFEAIFKEIHNRNKTHHQTEQRFPKRVSPMWRWVLPSLALPVSPSGTRGR